MNNKRIEFSKKLDRIPVSDYHGLENQGATCYLNSVLQVLFMTRDFREDMKSRVRHSGQDSAATIDPHLGRLFVDLERHTANTHNITKCLGITKVHEQRDSAEYLEKILSLTSPDVSEIFKGHLRHRTTCSHCWKQTDVDGLFWTLPLSMEVSHSQSYSVSDGFKAFFIASELDRDNKMYCETCKTKTRATIESQLTKDPEILILLLKRFEFDCGQMCYVKLHCCVDVPQTLQTENGRYDFYASVDHFGSIKGGHYTATVRSYETGEWYCFNDTYVRKIKPPFGPRDTAFRSKNAYLLLYRKVASTDSQVKYEANPELRMPEQKCEESSWWDNDMEIKTQREASVDRKMNKQQNHLLPHLFQETCDVAYWQEPRSSKFTHEDHLDNVKKAVRQTMTRLDDDVKMAMAMAVYPAERGITKEINTREHQRVYKPQRYYKASSEFDYCHPRLNTVEQYSAYPCDNMADGRSYCKDSTVSSDIAIKSVQDGKTEGLSDTNIHRDLKQGDTHLCHTSPSGTSGFSQLSRQTQSLFMESKPIGSLPVSFRNEWYAPCPPSALSPSKNDRSNKSSTLQGEKKKPPWKY